MGGSGSCSLSILSFQAEVMWFPLALFAYNREKRLQASSSLPNRLSVCLSVRAYQLGSHWADFRGVSYWTRILKSVEKIRSR